MTTGDSANSAPAGGAPLETVEVTTGEAPTAAVVWLHGLGADGHDFEPIVPWLKWPAAPAIRFVFPHAPVRPVTVNGGMQMRAWYDIRGLQIDRDQDEAGILESIGLASRLVQRERDRGIEPGRIVVAGFSQGGAIAVQAALRYPEKLAGVIALSTYLLIEQRLVQERHEANSDLPVFYGHGSSDPVVPPVLGEHAVDALRGMGHDVEAHTYPMQHAVCPEEIAHIAGWLQKRL